MPEPDPRFEVPPEYAGVYEEAFRRASNTDPGESGEDKGTGGVDADRHPSWWSRRPAALSLVLLVVVVVGIAAFAVGRAVSDRAPVAQPPGPSTQPESASVSPSSSPTALRSRAVTPLRATTACPAPRVSDARGTALSFAPANALDDDSRTSWACSGSAVGQELVLSLPAGRRVTTVGLLPTAQVGGVQLNRIRAVDWVFDDGTTVRQNLSVGSAPVVELQAVPAQTARTVRLRLASVSSGPADLTAVSSVFLSGPTG